MSRCQTVVPVTEASQVGEARRRAARLADLAGLNDTDRGRVAIVVTELANMKDASEHVKALHYAFTALTVIGSWLLVGVMYCLHYAHIYYTANEHALPLAFPDEHTQPNYWDFLYFSFTLSIAVQTSDVTVRTREMRKLVLGHCVLAFFFNATLLALAINLAAGLLL